MDIPHRGHWTALATALALLLPACEGPHPSFAITRVGWYEENIDPSFWQSTWSPSQNAYYDFFIHYEGDITFGDLRSVRVYTPAGSYWDILRDQSILDTTQKVIGGWHRWYGGPAPNILLLGEMRVEVTLADGRVIRATRTIPAPGSASVGTYTAMYTEDVTFQPADSAPMVRRVSIGPGATLDVAAQTLSLSFATTDPIARDGWVWFYDAADAYLGASVRFRQPLTGEVAPQLGGQLHTDGATNALALRLADLVLVPGATMEQIARARVVMTDGAQYGAESPGGYDCQSIGPAAAVAHR